jgi:hypothetical protein
MLDIEIDEAGTTTVHQWIVTGEPGVVPGYFGDAEPPRFPSYRFVWSSADTRWLGNKAELEARGFVERVRTDAHGLGALGKWEEGPFLHHRVVTYGPLEPVVIDG